MAADLPYLPDWTREKLEELCAPWEFDQLAKGRGAVGKARSA